MKKINTKKTVLLAGLAMSLAFATGCKNHSNSPVRPLIVPQEVKVNAAKKEVSKVVTTLAQTRKDLAEAQEETAKLQDALEIEIDPVMRAKTVAVLDVNLQKVKVLEDKVALEEKMLLEERKKLGKVIDPKSEFDPVAAGAGFDIDVDADRASEIAKKEDRIARVDLAYRTAVESRENQILITENIARDLKEKEDKLAQLESVSSEVVDPSINELKVEIERTEKDFEMANRQLALLISQEASLAKAVK